MFAVIKDQDSFIIPSPSSDEGEGIMEEEYDWKRRIIALFAFV